MSDFTSRPVFSNHLRVMILCLISSCLHINSVYAIERIDQEELAHWVPVSDDELNAMRGGFVLPNGMNLDISVLRSVSINGVETLSSNISLPDNFNWVRNGSDNYVANLNLPVLSDVIQNTLDNQLIQSVRVVNVELSNLQGMASNRGAMIVNHVVIPNL